MIVTVTVMITKPATGTVPPNLKGAALEGCRAPGWRLGAWVRWAIVEDS
jgi:hypothetical protein